MAWSGIKRLLRGAGNAALDVIYPAHCLACDTRTSDEALPLCRLCAELLQPIDPSERCSTCFAEVHDEGGLSCRRCEHRAPLWDGKAAVFAYRDTAAALVRHMKYGNKPHLSRGAAAFMAIQAHRLGWPAPDVIIPVPIPWPRLLERGYNQSRLLAQQLSPLWGGAVVEALTRDAGEWSQAGLSATQRRQLTAECFHVRKDVDIRGKVVCLVDDVITTGSTLDACAEAVLSCDIAALFALTLCRAEKIH